MCPEPDKPTSLPVTVQRLVWITSYRSSESANCRGGRPSERLSQMQKLCQPTCGCEPGGAQVEQFQVAPQQADSLRSNHLPWT
jgi:hypothetical protein